MDAIRRDPEVMHGAPVFRGTRVPVQTLFDYLEGGDSLEEFLEGFPTVSRQIVVSGSRRVQGTSSGASLMRLLLDECVDEKLRHHFDGHECYSARYAEKAGLKNGALLSAAEDAGFEVIKTTDQEIPYQQNLSLRRISIIILRAPTNRLADLKRLVPASQRALDSILPGQVVTVGAAG